MPIYEYACGKCEAEFEAEQRITDDPLKKCPECGSKRVKRLISRTSFALKGGGWYADGYGAPSAKKGPESGASSESGTKSESSESKSKPASGDKAKGEKAVA